MNLDQQLETQPDSTPKREQPAKELLTTENEPSSKVHWAYYFAMAGSMLLAVGFYVGIYFLNQMSTTTLSYYYGNAFAVASNSVGAGATAAATLQTTQPTADVTSIVKTVGFGWLMWKLANSFYIIDVTGKLVWWRKLIGASISVLGLLALDVIMTWMMLQSYADWVFVAAALGLTVVLGLLLHINHEPKPAWHVLFRNGLLPFLGYAVIVAVYWLALPYLYQILNTMNNGTSLTGSIIFFYVFPLIDTLLVCFAILLNWSCSPECHQFLSQLNMLLMGYRVGIMLLISYYEVEFYYILGFCMLRNLFLSYVLEVHHLANFNIATVMWVLAYYVNYLFSFNPLIGINKTIISVNYSNYQTTNTNTVLYGLYSTSYPYSGAYSDSATGTGGLNMSFTGTVVYFVAGIIWVGETFTTRYRLQKIDWKFPFFCLFGVMLFFVGLSSALNISTLSANVF